jgi:hypothetical protein
VFYGSGQETLPAGASWSLNAAGQYVLSGDTNTMTPGVPYTLFVYVSDRYYSTVARLSLRFSVVESLRGEVTTAVNPSNYGTLQSITSNVYEVTEGGTS